MTDQKKTGRVGPSANEKQWEKDKERGQRGGWCGRECTWYPTRKSNSRLARCQGESGTNSPETVTSEQVFLGDRNSKKEATRIVDGCDIDRHRSRTKDTVTNYFPSLSKPLTQRGRRRGVVV